MIWFIWAFIAAVLSSIWSLSVKKGLEHMIGTDFVSWYGLIALVAIFVMNTIQKIPFMMNIPALLSGLFGGLTIIALTDSVKKSPNPGMSMAVYRSQAVLTTVLAVFVFDSHITAKKLLAMCVVLAGVYILSTGQSTPSIPDTEEDEGDKHNKKGLNWIYITLIAIVVGSLYDLTTKGAFNNKKSGSFENILLNSFLTQAIILMIYDRYKTGNFKLEDINQDKKVDFKDVGITIWTGFMYFLYCYIGTKSIELAPNVGYA